MSQATSRSGQTVIEDIFTKEEQDELTPESVIELLKEGNARYVSGEVASRNCTAQIPKATQGQYPKAIVLSCIDSRVPVEHVFDQGIGDLFVARVAGNFINTDILGSMEFACHVAGSKVVLVLGHESCGAIKGAIDGVELGNLTAMLEKVKPAIEQTEGHDEERTSKNDSFVRAVTEKNVQLAVEAVRRESPVLRKMEEEGELKICGAVYAMENGRVDFFS